MVGIRRRLERRSVCELFRHLAGQHQSDFPVYVFPLVSWIWIGYWVLLFGTIICLIPGKVRLQYARTEVVGIATCRSDGSALNCSWRFSYRSLGWLRRIRRLT